MNEDVELIYVDRIEKLERLVELLSVVYYLQDDEQIEALCKELWPDD